MEPEPLKREEVKFYIREVGKETALHLLRQLGLIPIEAHFEPFAEAPIEAPIESFAEAPIESFAEAPIESFAEAPIESFTEAPIESFAEAPIESFAEAPIESFAEAPIEAPIEAHIESVAETPVEVPIIKASTKPPVTQNLAMTSCSGMATTSLLQAKYLVETAPFVHLVLHTHAAVFVFDPGGTNISNPPAVIPRFF